MDARRGGRGGDPGPWRQQAVLGRGRWEADALRDVVRDYALEVLADRDAVLVLDETGFLKQGKASCGVARQHTGSAGKITNCQIGVFAAYVSRHGRALIDRALYLPKTWADDRARRAAAHIPEAVEFATKPRLALRMIERAIAADVPFAWVAADTVYGAGEIGMALRRAGKGYVLGVTGTHQSYSWSALPMVAGSAEEVAKALPPAAWRRLSAGEGTKVAKALPPAAWRRLSAGEGTEVAKALPPAAWRRLSAGEGTEVAKALPPAAWRRLSAGEGTEGPRLHDWAYHDWAYLELADLEADDYVGGFEGVWTRGLLIRRHVADGELAYFTTWCPAGTQIETLVAVAGHRWAIEDAFETAKTELGLDHNETRSWHGWHRHVSLVMLAFAVTRRRANAAAEETTPLVSRGRRRSSAGHSRRSAASPRALRSAASSPPSSSHGQFGAELTKPPRSASI